MSRLARTVTRPFDLAPNTTLALALTDAGLAAAVTSLTQSAGALLPEEGPVHHGLLDLETVPDPLVPERAKALITRVVPGGVVVVVVHQPGDEHVNELAARLGPSLDLTEVQAERDGVVVVLRAKRRQPLSKPRIKELRGIGHGIEANVLVGRAGLSAEIVAAARAALERHGLIKAKLTPQCEVDKDVAADELAWATGAILVQRIGKMMLLYRPDVKLAPPVTHRRGG